MSDSEEDYMSSKFLVTPEDEQPKTYSQRRKDQLREQQQKAYIKPRAQLEQEAREKGLQESVAEGNKGMQMLMKMGFKKGMALGKSGEGLKAPIAIELKQESLTMEVGRSGVGTKRALDEEAKEQESKRIHVDPEDYRNLMAQRAREAHTERRAAAAASLVEGLDKGKGIEANVLWIFNIPEKDKGDEEDHADEEETEKLPYPEEEMEELRALPLDDRLERLVGYLRTEHMYCFWCGAKYDDQQDLAENCPGPEEDDH
ncbi:hypothetical protein BX666DRAFT_1877308 [Dichotomocladium elegans]|nr:hypothetical protein BX666DRAFT_1877308 [Dichotomocladium elegans]